MSRKRAVKAQARNQQRYLEEALYSNGQAQVIAPRRKSWSFHDLRNIKPMTQTQAELCHEFARGQNICAIGSAGTGKTYMAIYLALNELLDPGSKIERIIIARSAVATRDLGHLPGDVNEKIAVYEAPYVDMFHDFIGRASTYEDMKEAELVEFCPTSYVRGTTWDNAIVVVDECQNMTWHEINSVMTRVGKHSRVMLMGDIRQTDLTKRGDESGMKKLLAIIERVRQFSLVEFTHDDIVRSGFVKAWIIATEQFESGELPYEEERPKRTAVLLG